MEKRCSSCGATKALTDFPRNRSRKDGRGDACSVCNRDRYYRWRDRNPAVGNGTTTFEIFTALDLGAEPDGVGGSCWRFSPSRRYAKGRPVRQVIAELVTGSVLPQPVEFWCGNDWCCNPDHAIPHGQLASVSDEEVVGISDDVAAAGFTMLEEIETTPAQTLDRLESIPFRTRMAEASMNADDPSEARRLERMADRLLRANGWTEEGLPASRSLRP